jgi:cytochrome c peroxidase
MHDGRMFSLSKVIDHYRKGIDTTQVTLDTLLRKRLVISEQERVDLLSFLYTLRDEDLLRDARFASPNYIQPAAKQEH